MGAIVALGPLAAIAVGSADHTSSSGGSGLSSSTGGTTTTGTAPTGTTTTGTTPTGTTTTGTTPTGTTTTGTTPTGTTTSTTTTPTPPPTAPPPKVIRVPRHNPFAHRAMWIWELPYSSGGNVSQIISQARQSGVKLLIIKSGDGTGSWSQFTPALVQQLHAAGLKVCGWQYVYGQHPVWEANVGIRTVRDGADCLVIDAESEYEGRYVHAQSYINHLRAGIGKRFPVALAGFPWVDYHPSFPYSVFLGPNGAQYNVPQMYWKAIQVSVRGVFAHTYEWNEIYRRPIYPLGQMFDATTPWQIKRFNALVRAYHSRGASWWDWQSATAAEFKGVTKVATLPSWFTPTRTAVSISRGYQGDYVLWAQEYLGGWAARHETGKLSKLAIDGDFGPHTQAVVKAYQERHHMPVTGVIDGYMWDRLLTHTRPLKVRWIWRRHHPVAVASRKHHHKRKHRRSAHAARARGTERVVVPSFLRHPHGRNELHGVFGRGGQG